jgi:hypothetical protein
MLKLMLTLGCSVVFAPFCVGQALSDSRKADISESVYRYQIAQCYKDRSPPETYLLSYEGHDPDDTLMARFASYGSRVMKRSQMRHFKNIETGKWPIILSVTEVDLRSPRVAYVRAACVGGALDSYEYLYRVLLRNGRWFVVRRRLTGIG